jgi:hypothetical protein
MAEASYNSVKAAAKKTFTKITMQPPAATEQESSAPEPPVAPAALAVPEAAMAAAEDGPGVEGALQQTAADPHHPQAPAPAAKKRGRPQGSRTATKAAGLPKGAQRSLTIYFSQEQYSWLFSSSLTRSAETQTRVSVGEIVRDCVENERKRYG